VKNREYLIYISRFFSGFAGWLVFLAVALMIKEQYGSNHVPLAFVWQAIPPLLLSNWLARKTPEHKMKTVFIWSQVLGIVALFLLAVPIGLIGIYTFIFLNSLIQTVSNPILISMAMKTVDKDRWHKVHIRLSSVQATTLALAPIFGGWFSMAFGFGQLLVLTAFCGLVGIAFIYLAIPQFDEPAPKGKQEHLKWFQQWQPLKIDSWHLRRGFALWTLFLAIGAFLNTVEFPVFETMGLSRSEIGQMLGSWGVGNLLAFFAATRVKNIFPASVASVVFAAALALFLAQISLQAALFAFAVGGFINSYLAGSLRNYISENTPTHSRSLDVWAAVNQRLGLVNLSVYALGGLALPYAGETVMGLPMVAFALIVAGSLFLQRPPDARS